MSEQVINYYRCQGCDRPWADIWDCEADDDCPQCGDTCTPHESHPADRGDQPIPSVLFDGHAVLQALSEQARRRTSPENVSDVLDAVVRLMKQERGAQ